MFVRRHFLSFLAALLPRQHALMRLRCDILVCTSYWADLAMVWSPSSELRLERTAMNDPSPTWAPLPKDIEAVRIEVDRHLQ
eukprot:7710892-Pyramimonas_sp.AAC.1